MLSIHGAAAQTAAYHLTARPWNAAQAGSGAILDTLDGLCRFSARHQDSSGAIVDPFLHREVQYATPYFAYAVGTLVRAGRSRDLLARGVAAMEHSTSQFAQGREAIPDQHGEFFIAALTEALDVYKGLVPEEQVERWRARLTTPLDQLVGPLRNNWQTYAMKGEWLRATHGLASRREAVSYIERCWKEGQRDRIVATQFHLYHDRSSDPDTLSVEVVGRGNLLALLEAGYDGPSAAEMRAAIDDGSATALLLQDPTGQLPANGRTDDHVWADVGQAVAFQAMANDEWRKGNRSLAGQFQQAANLVLPEVERYRRGDGEWSGSFYITKNHFDPELRVGYQDASHVSNYTGSMMFHLAELYNLRQFAIPAQPAPAEIGGYAIELDPAYATVVADAGGMQVQINLRGQTAKSSGNYWTPLGIVRFARAGWDARLGPSDGALTAAGGVTFAPEFYEDGGWHRMADLSDRYHAEWRTEFVNPALVRGSIQWHPLPGKGGPSFETRLWITPGGVFCETVKTSSDAAPWAVTWPLLVNDGRPLDLEVSQSSASVSFSGGGDQESFLAVGDGARIETRVPALRSSYGDLLAVRAMAPGAANQTLVYPHFAGEPTAEAVQRSLRRTLRGFTSLLGTVEGDLYFDKTVAGGEGTALFLARGASAAVTFDRRCGFLAKLANGRIVALETDRDVTASLGSRRIALKAHQPVEF